MVDIINFQSILFKSSISLAVVIAKQHFLQVCLDHGVLPNGFLLKFSLQTGLPAEDVKNFGDMVTDALSTASFQLLNITLRAENLKAELLYKKIFGALNNLVLEDRSISANIAVAKFKKILILRSKIHVRKMKNLLSNIQPLILDLDEVVSNFETKIVKNIETSSVQPAFDWYDEVDFPPLESSIRRDWTLDILEAPLIPDGNTLSMIAEPEAPGESIHEGYPRTSSVVLHDFSASNPSHDTALVTSSPHHSGAPLIIPSDVNNISEVVLETRPKRKIYILISNYYCGLFIK